MLSGYIFNKGLKTYNHIFKKQRKDPKSLFSKGSIDLYDAMKNSYAKEEDQKRFGRDAGYVYDEQLSNDNQQVYYNPDSKKMIFSITGTHNISDVGSDLKMMTSGVKSTDRYRQAEMTLGKAKAKYNPSHTTAYGTSLGGSIASKLEDKADRVVTLNKAHIPFDKTGSKETAIRSRGDIVSVFAANGKHVHTIANGDLTDPMTWLRSHSSDSIKGKGYFIG